MVINQSYLFLIFTLNGILIGFLFDFFRILRKIFKTANYITYIEDILFWILTGISIIFFLYKFSDGNLRVFIFIGLIFGFILYMLTLSKIIINIFVHIINFIIKILEKIFLIVKVPIKNIYNFLKKLILNEIYEFITREKNNIIKRFKKNKKICKKS